MRLRDATGAVAAETGRRGEYEARRAPRMVPENGSALLAECGSDEVDGRVCSFRFSACTTKAVAGARRLDDIFGALNRVDGDGVETYIVE